jgi:malate dehydrogenase (oxaloacetate-decarboxylating)(NADP+)
MFGFKPVTAMITFANFGASKHPSVKKVSDAVDYLHRYYPDLDVDGPLQSDFALNKEMLEEKFPFSELVKKNVNTLIFPNLESANITYKMLKELNGAQSVGPILLGLEKAVHVLQLGASVDEMVNMAAVAVVDAQQKQKL